MTIHSNVEATAPQPPVVLQFLLTAISLWFHRAYSIDEELRAVSAQMLSIADRERDARTRACRTPTWAELACG